MFSTPSLRLTNHENTDTLMRKPQVSSVRKAFQDRSVNSKLNNQQHTPFNKPKINIQSCEQKDVLPDSKRMEVPTWMMQCSVAEPDFEFDILPAPTKSDVLHMFMSSYPKSPAPPSPVKDINWLLDLPEPTALKFKFSEDLGSDDSGLWDDEQDSFVMQKPCCNFDF